MPLTILALKASIAIQGIAALAMVALTDAKFTALVAAVAGIVNTVLAIILTQHTKAIRKTNKQATQDLIEQVKPENLDE